MNKKLSAAIVMVLCLVLILFACGNNGHEKISNGNAVNNAAENNMSNDQANNMSGNTADTGKENTASSNTAANDNANAGNVSDNENSGTTGGWGGDPDDVTNSAENTNNANNTNNAENTENAADNEPTDWVYAMWGEDLLGSFPDITEYKDDTSQNARIVIFDTSREVENFYYTNVSLIRLDDEGQPVFQCEQLFMLKTLEPLKGFAVWMSFPGDLPSNGIMYTDPISGEVREFTISISGEDGSLVLTEFYE